MAQLLSSQLSQQPRIIPPSQGLFRGYAKVVADRPGAFTGSKPSSLPAGGCFVRGGPSIVQSGFKRALGPNKVSSKSNFHLFTAIYSRSLVAHFSTLPKLFLF